MPPLVPPPPDNGVHTRMREAFSKVLTTDVALEHELAEVQALLLRPADRQFSEDLDTLAGNMDQTAEARDAAWRELYRAARDLAAWAQASGWL